MPKCFQDEMKTWGSVLYAPFVDKQKEQAIAFVDRTFVRWRQERAQAIRRLMRKGHSR